MQYGILWLQRDFLENFWKFFRIFEDGNGGLVVDIDPSASNGVSLEPSWPKEFKNVDGKNLEPVLSSFPDFYYIKISILLHLT